MTLTIFRIMGLRLINNPLELVSVFVVPVAFFSLFAMIFSYGIATAENKKIRVGIIDSGASAAVKTLIPVLTGNAALDCRRIGPLSDERSINDFIRNAHAANRYDLIVRLAESHDGSDHPPSTTPNTPAIALITDGQNPMAVAVVQSIVKGFLSEHAARVKLAAAAASRRHAPRDVDPSMPAMNPRGDRARPGGVGSERGLATTIRDPAEVFSSNPPRVVQEVEPPLNESDRSTGTDEVRNEQLPPQPEVATTERIEAIDHVVQNLQAQGRGNPRVAMYAAGIAVLFLLFSATGNAATLLEEQETGTLDRILASRARLEHIVLGKWLWMFFLGCLQIGVMFAWAELIFGIQLGDHLPGFCIMTASTAAATSSFAMFLATLCKSRAQLSALSVLIILSMSALGGSMIPRFAMSDRMREIGKWTFNAWAIDGFQKVFWHRLPIESLQLEVLVLCGSAIVLGLVSYLLSARWKTQ